MLDILIYALLILLLGSFTIRSVFKTLIVVSNYRTESLRNKKERFRA